MEKGINTIKRILLGKALSSEQAGEEKLSKLWGLPIMASDAVSSVAYAVEEILRAMILPLGILSVKYVGLVSLPIIILLLILIFSYTQIINYYPDGGGAYVVSKENFGKSAALLSAACLVIDYVMTVAVSISSSSAAIGVIFPVLGEHRILISILSIGIITLLNLRGVGEASRIFGFPTYIFIISMLLLVLLGGCRFIAGDLPRIAYSEAVIMQIESQKSVAAITLLIFLRAFSSGCSALTGVEAVSNAIPSFKEPSQRNAKIVLVLLGIIIITIFGGTSILAGALKVLPIEGTTVLSQMAEAVFGKNILYYILQFTTSLILLLAANTAYNGLPNLLSILAKDHYMPHQFSQRGTKLSFSNGIMFLFFVTAILLVLFQADTHRLIPFYSVGVFVSFTLSQAGMFMKWYRVKSAGWVYKSAINGIGTAVTLMGSVVVFITKFADGAWMLAIAIPLIMLFMSITRNHYRIFEKEISIDQYDYTYHSGNSNVELPFIVLIHNINKAALKTLDYAISVSSNIIALHIATDHTYDNHLTEQWHKMGIEIPLLIIDAPYREILVPLEEYIRQREQELDNGEKLTVVITKFVGNGWRDALFHNQTSFFIQQRLGSRKKVVTVFVPYLYHRKEDQ